VQHDREASTTGHGTNVIQGLGVSMKSTRWPAIGHVGGISSPTQLGGLYGIAIAVTVHAGDGRHHRRARRLRPVTDNAGGIAEMAGLPKEVRTSPTRSTRSATPPRP
jgi:K(+)-stimulated pyrophosphate-energized sodium pump